MRLCSFLSALVLMVMAAASGAGSEGFVIRSGQYLAVEGKPVHLHGGSFYGAPWRSEGFSHYADTWLGRAQVNGMNTLRVCDFIDTSKADWNDERTWKNLDYLVDAAAKRKMYLILDLSTYRNMLKQTNGNDSQAAISAAYDPARWADFTAFISARYKNAPALAFYSIAGECDAPAGKKITTAALTGFYDRVSAQLRAGDAHHLISSGGLEFLDWNSGVDWKSIFSLPNIQMAAVHVYSKGDISVLPKVAGWTRRPDVNIPFVIEEFGIKQGADDAARAMQVKDIYALGSQYTSVGSLFWNVGPELSANSCDLGPQTPAAWKVVRESEAFFRTGFEAADPQPIAPELPKTTGRDSTPASKFECTVRPGVSHSGERALRFASAAPPGVPRFLPVYQVGLAIRHDTKLSYWINPEQANGRFVAVNLHCTDGTWLHDTGAVDLKGRSMSARAGHGGAIPLNHWSEIRCDIGRWLEGKMVDTIVVSYNHPNVPGPFSSLIDDLVVTNGTP